MIFGISLITVLLASVGAFAVGGLWYGPIFGAKWKSLMGFSDEVMQNMHMTPLRAMSLSFFATVVWVFMLANLLQALSVATLADALAVSFWVWFGFVATILLNSVFYENRSWTLYLLNASHYLVAFLVAGYLIVLLPF